MGLSVQCACGNALEGDNLDLVVTMSCPHCRRELTLEIDDATGVSRRPVLTVVQGPHWVGQQFVMPVGIDLSIGRAGANWLTLDDASISDTHCKVRLLPDSGLILEDQKSASGTWVGPKRVARGKLISSQPFRLGNFQLRLELRPIEAPAPPPAPINLNEDEPSVRFDVSKPEPAFLRWFVTNRFQISRTYMWAGAWLMGMYHAVAWFGAAKGWGQWSRLALGSILIAGAMLLSGSRVSLAHRHFKYASLGVLVVLAILDFIWMFQGAAIACLCLAACITILVMRIPTGLLAMLVSVVGAAGLLVLFGATLKRVIELVTAA